MSRMDRRATANREKEEEERLQELETGDGDRSWRQEMETGVGDRSWRQEMETGVGDRRWGQELETGDGDRMHFCGIHLNSPGAKNSRQDAPLWYSPVFS
jgi:hypothetical protein